MITKKKLEKKIEKLKALKRKNPSKFHRMYSEAMKSAIKDGNSYVLETVPEEFRWYVLYKRKSRRNRDRFKYKIRACDKRIYVNKFYPYSYHNLEPVLVLTGWFSRKNAKLLYDTWYGKSWRETVKFIKGKKAIQLGFKIGKSLYINGRYRKPKTKLSVLKSYKYSNNKKSYRWNIISDICKENYSDKEKENIIVKRVLDKYETHQCDIPTKEIRVNPKITKDEKLKLPKIQEIKQIRKKDLYEM